MKEVTLSKIIGKTGVFIDGDWVESKDQEPNGDVRLIQLADIGDGVFINKSNRFLTSEKAKDLKCTFLKQGDLLIARMPDPLGRSCIFPGINMPCVTVVDICIVRPDANIADSEWLKFLINSYDFRNKINKYITGTTRQRISRGNLEKLSFGLPPLHDQLHIANLLSKAENLISQRKQSIALLDEFLKSTFLEMFGDFKEMSTSKLDFLGDNISYLTSGSRGWAQYYSESGAKFLRIQNIGGGIIRMDNLIHVNPPDSAEADRTRVKEGDLLISITADLGRTSVIPKDFGEAYINQHLALIRLNKNINPIYAAYFYNMPFGNNAIQKACCKNMPHKWD